MPWTFSTYNRDSAAFANWPVASIADITGSDPSRSLTANSFLRAIRRSMYVYHRDERAAAPLLSTRQRRHDNPQKARGEMMYVGSRTPQEISSVGPACIVQLDIRPIGPQLCLLVARRPMIFHATFGSYTARGPLPFIPPLKVSWFSATVMPGVKVALADSDNSAERWSHREEMERRTEKTNQRQGRTRAQLGSQLNSSYGDMRQVKAHIWL